MSWQEWLGGLLMLLGAGGIIIVLAEMLCGWLKLDRKRPDPAEFEEPADSEYMQNRVRQLRAMAKHRAVTTDAGADALVAEISREIETEAARIAKSEVRR